MLSVPSHVRISLYALILALFAAFYVIIYLSALDLPGRYAYPLGWWGWVDQGLYLKSAQALARLDFRSSEHWYPIAYSALAAPFVKKMAIHPFFVIDLACFLVVVGGFLKIGSKVVGLVPSALIFLAVICFPWVLAPHWVIPWTSTLSAAITTFLLVACANERFVRGFLPLWRYLAFGLLTGILALVRPLDFAIDLVMFGYIALRCLGTAYANNEFLLSRRLCGIAAALAASACVGPLAMAAFNWAVYGSVISTYVQVSQDSGFTLSIVPQKIVSLFNDSESLFMVRRQTFIAGYPWLVASIAMIPTVLAFGSNILRLITTIACVHFAMYLAYGDLIPNNIYLFGTIHYFKLWMPYLALVAAAGLLHFMRTRNTPKVRIVALAGALVAGLLCSLGFRLVEEPIKITQVGPLSIVIERVARSQVSIAYIDFPNLVSDDFPKYEAGRSQFIADGERLRRLGDFRLLKGEVGARALFTAPLKFRRLEIVLDDSFKIPPGITGNAVHYEIGLRWPF